MDPSQELFDDDDRISFAFRKRPALLPIRTLSNYPDIVLEKLHVKEMMKLPLNDL